MIQVVGGDSSFRQYRINITQGEYGIWSDTVLVDYLAKDGDKRLLEDDLVEFWGNVKGETSYKSVLNADVYLPHIQAFQITLIQ